MLPAEYYLVKHLKITLKLDPTIRRTKQCDGWGASIEERNIEMVDVSTQWDVAKCSLQHLDRISLHPFRNHKYNDNNTSGLTLFKDLHTQTSASLVVGENADV